MKNLITLILMLFVSIHALAEEKFPDYKTGEGAHYEMTVDGQPAQVKMAFVQRMDKILILEIDMRMASEGSTIPIHMVQQFHLGLRDGKIQLLKGFMKIPNISKPQELPADFLKGYNGAQMNSFIISSKDDIEGSLVGKEKLTTAEGTFEASHYKRTSNGQTVDFWITEDPKIKPMSILKMKSSGSKKEQNYTMKLKGLVKGYRSQINASNSEPLNAMGRMFLPMLTTSSFLH